MKTPFFSIVIPTYNRVKDLSKAVLRILKQNCIDYEIIITDNNSNDGTEKFVRSLKEKKICYFKNKRNIGFINNLKKGISLARGKYILLHGDDDFFLWDDSISLIKQILETDKYGFLRVNFLTRIPRDKDIFCPLKLFTKKMKIDKEANLKQIIKFIEDINASFITGVIFKNNFPKNIQIIKSEKTPWLNMIYYNIKKNGGTFDPKFFFLSSWTMSGNLGNTYYLIKGQIQTEEYLNHILKKAKKSEYNYFILKYVNPIVRVFPAIKYFTNNKNLILVANRLLQISPNHKKSLSFWVYFLISLITPRFLLHIIRLLNLKYIKKLCLINSPKIIKRIQTL